MPVKRRIPEVGTAEFEAEASFYRKSTKDERIKRAQELGYKNKDSYETVMARSGAKLPDIVIPPVIPQETTVNLPPVTLKRYKPINMGRIGNPETQVLHLTDHHWGQVTKSFNPDIAKTRYEYLFQSVLRITNLHRKLYPINDLVIFVTGDMVHGENVYQGAKVGTISCGAREQVITLAFPNLSEFILSLKQEFKTVRVKCVPGNHGRYSREAPATSNWDMMLYDLLKTKLEPYGAEVEIADNFFLMTEVQGHRFFLAHFDQFRATMGVPWFAMMRGIQSWFVTYGGFDYIVGGHFHRDDFFRVNSRCKLVMGASIVTGDSFTEEVIKTSSIPCQWTFGVHREKGLTWPYSLIVDEKFFPKSELSGKTG